MSSIKNKSNGKGNAFTIQAWKGPKCSRRFRFPDFNTLQTYYKNMVVIYVFSLEEAMYPYCYLCILIVSLCYSCLCILRRGYPD